jgi:general secretion pathway protein G
MKLLKPTTYHLKPKHGFTLIELLVVIAIIGVLVTVGTVSYQRASKLSRDTRRKTDLEQIRQALETYRSENGTYPSTAQGTSVLQSGGYITTVPTDPKQSSGYSYTYTQVTGTTYNLCATVENPTPTSYCVHEP